MLRIASFDIGLVNFAQYVEDFDSKILNQVAPPRYMLPEFAEFAESMCSGTRIITGVYDFGNFSKADDHRLTIEHRNRLIAHLEKYYSVFVSTDFFVIEQQYFNPGFFGKTKVNVKAIKLAEVLTTWLMITFPFKKIVQFPSKYKTTFFNAGKLNDRTRKIWAINKAREVYTSRHDEEAMLLFDVDSQVSRKGIKKRQEVYNSTKCCFSCPELRRLCKKVAIDRQKLDDISDAMLQAQAYKMFICCSRCK